MPFQSRPRRYPLLVPAELTHLQSTVQMKQLVSDLSPYGCHVSTQQMWPIGSKVRIRIESDDKAFSAMARIVYDLPMLGMGVAFTEIAAGDQAVLDSWIAELREHMENPPR